MPSSDKNSIFDNITDLLAALALNDINQIRQTFYRSIFDFVSIFVNNSILWNNISYYCVGPNPIIVTIFIPANYTRLRNIYSFMSLPLVSGILLQPAVKRSRAAAYIKRPSTLGSFSTSGMSFINCSRYFSLISATLLCDKNE